MLAVPLGKALEGFERGSTAICRRVPVGHDIGYGGRAVGIPLATRNRREIKQNFHLVFIGPFHGAIDIVDAGNIGFMLVLRAKRIPGKRNAHGVEPHRRHSLKVELGDERLVVLANALVIGGGS